MKRETLRSTRHHRTMIAMGTLLVMALPAQAAVTAGTASGLGLNVDVSALALVTLGVGPLAQVAVTSPAPDNQSAGVLSVSETVLLGSVVANNGVDNAIVGSALSDVTGVGISGLSEGSATTNNLGITVIPEVLFLTPAFLTLTSTTIGSTSTSSGQFGALGSVGTTVLENLSISVGGIVIAIAANPAPNTTLDLAASGVTDAGILANLSIILNEQILTGDGSTSTGITTNALRISIGALNFGGVSGLNGDIIVGQSTSTLTAIPEPTVPMALLLAPVALLFRRRR